MSIHEKIEQIVNRTDVIPDEILIDFISTIINIEFGYTLIEWITDLSENSEDIKEYIQNYEIDQYITE